VAIGDFDIASASFNADQDKLRGFSSACGALRLLDTHFQLERFKW
jgi:hypothetical protein